MIHEIERMALGGRHREGPAIREDREVERVSVDVLHRLWEYPETSPSSSSTAADGSLRHLLARYQKVSLADIKRVAQRYLRPDSLIVMVAGNIEECKAGADQTLRTRRPSTRWRRPTAADDRRPREEVRGRTVTVVTLK